MHYNGKGGDMGKLPRERACLDPESGHKPGLVILCSARISLHLLLIFTYLLRVFHHILSDYVRLDPFKRNT